MYAPTAYNVIYYVHACTSNTSKKKKTKNTCIIYIRILGIYCPSGDDELHYITSCIKAYTTVASAVGRWHTGISY